MQRVRMHMHERVLLCSTTRRTRKIANAEANNPNLMMLENANFSSSSCYLLRITRDTISIISRGALLGVRVESYYPPCPFRSRNVKREEFFPQSKFIKLAIISYPRTNYDRSDPRTDYRNVCPFRKQQQQQQRGRLPFLWIFLLSLLSSLPSSLSLSLQPLSTSPPSFPLERSSKDLGRPRGELSLIHI